MRERSAPMCAAAFQGLQIDSFKSEKVKTCCLIYKKKKEACDLFIKKTVL